MVAIMLRHALDSVRLVHGPTLLLCATVLAGCGARPATETPLRHVVLYQNGIGYFEHAGRPRGRRIDLAFHRHEIGDVLKTLTVVSAPPSAATVSVSEPDAPATVAGQSSYDGPGTAASAEDAGGHPDRMHVAIRLDRPAEEVAISYAVPTPAWKASYRLILPAAGGDALLQGWAVVNNTSEQDWRDVKLTLATGAPLSFAIDLHTPEYVPRPDVTGQLVQPVTSGAVRAERGLPGDGDGDGTRDADDLCPRDAEDRDGWEDQDGCPDMDNDQDRILDTADQCPSEPETYNGVQDDDGCPDRGRVVVTDTTIEILDKVYFQRGSAEIQAQSLPIVEAIAATLVHNPDIRALEIQGHASDDERGAWDLSGRRALAVKSALESRGVAARLVARPYGATLPVRQEATEAARAANRRVDFLILERAGDQAAAASPTPVSTPALQASMRAQVTPRDVAGSVRYEIAEPVTIRRGASALVPIVNRRAQGEDVYLYRPDENAPESAQHPWRAGRLVHDGPLPLQPGPVAMFAGGAFVGEGLLERLHPGEIAFVPYALDSSTVVRVHSEDTDEPARIVAIARGVATVEDHLVRTTRYEIQTGASVPGRMFVRHHASPGFEILDLPPQTQQTATGHLLPLPLAPARTSVLEVKERKRVERGVEIVDLLGPRLTVYMGSGDLPDTVRDGLREVVALRQQLADHERASEELSDRLLELGSRAGEVRASMQAIGRDPRAASLRRRLLDSLTELTQESEKLGRALAERRASELELRTRLQAAVQRLALERTE